MRNLKKWVLGQFSQKREDIPYDIFFSVLTRALVSYFLVFFLTLDWSIYSLAANDLWSSVGGMGSLVSSFPHLNVLYGLLGLYAVVAGWLILKPTSSILLGLFLFLTVGFDILHNSMGFVNVQTHALLFLLSITLFRAFGTGNKENQFWTLRFMEVVYVMVYFQSAVSKLVKSGWAWGLDGTTLQIGMFRQLMPLGLEVSHFPVLCTIISVMVLVLELGFPAIYFLSGNKKYVMLFSISFHIGTYVFMGIHFFHLWVFPLAYLMTYFCMEQQRTVVSAQHC